jgi:sporulation related protein
MSGSGPRAADEINLDEFERRLRAAGGGQARAEDPLAELARLVEFAHLGIPNDEAPSRPRAAVAAAPAAPATPLETGALRPTIEQEVEDLAPGASEAEREARQDYAFDGASAAEAAEERRPMRWKIAAAALALAGLAMIGAVFMLRSGGPGFTKDPPFIAAAKGPTKVAPPSDQAARASSDAGASLLSNDVRPGVVKLVNSEEQPVDLSAQASVDNPPPANPAMPNPPAAADQATPPPGTASDAGSLAAPVNTPLVAPPAPLPPAMTPEFPAPKPVRTVSLRPDGTPIAMANPPDQAASAAQPASAAPEAPASPAPTAASDAAGAAQPSTPKLDLPPKPSAKSPARVLVGKTDTTAPEPSAETPREPSQNGASPKAERPAKKPKREVADATDTTGAIAEAPVDATAATASGGWAVQLGAPRSEAEANSEIARLTAKYGAELNGSPIGVHKATVKGETIYRLRVVGLTKADAAKLCARLKGEGADCFIAK